MIQNVSWKKTYLPLDRFFSFWHFDLAGDIVIFYKFHLIKQCMQYSTCSEDQSISFFPSCQTIWKRGYSHDRSLLCVERGWYGKLYWRRDPWLYNSRHFHLRHCTRYLWLGAWRSHCHRCTIYWIHKKRRQGWLEFLHCHQCYFHQITVSISLNMRFPTFSHILATLPYSQPRPIWIFNVWKCWFSSSKA